MEKTNKDESNDEFEECGERISTSLDPGSSDKKPRSSVDGPKENPPQPVSCSIPDKGKRVPSEKQRENLRKAREINKEKRDNRSEFTRQLQEGNFSEGTKDVLYEFLMDHLSDRIPSKKKKQEKKEIEFKEPPPKMRRSNPPTSPRKMRQPSPSPSPPREKQRLGINEKINTQPFETQMRNSSSHKTNRPAINIG